MRMVTPEEREISRKYGFRYYVIINAERTRGEHESRPRIQGSGIPLVSEGGRRSAVETFISGVSALHTWVPREWSAQVCCIPPLRGLGSQVLLR